MNTISSISSFRPVVVEKIASFSKLFKSNSEIVKEVLAETAIQVAHAKEEGITFSSAVFVVQDLDHLLKTINGSNPIMIGEGPANSRTVRVALKSSIPLGEGRQWGIYFLFKNDNLEYGIFLTERSSLKDTSFELLRQLGKYAGSIVGITRLGEVSLEVRGGGVCEYFDFGGFADLQNNPRDVIRTFTSSVTQDVDPQFRNQCETFFYRIVVEMLNSSHGALIAILRPGQKPPTVLSDGIWFKNPVFINPLIENYGKTKSEKDSLALIAYGSLIQKMASIDGVMVFGTDGSLHAYHCFIRESLNESTSSKVIGGARRRAFHTLCEYLDSEFSAVFYHSQDGATECRIKN